NPYAAHCRTTDAQFMVTDSLEEVLQHWLPTAISLAIALGAAVIAYRAGMAVLRRIMRHRPAAEVFISAGESAGAAVAAFFAIQIVLESAANDLPSIGQLRHLSTLLLIGAG